MRYKPEIFIYLDLIGMDLYAKSKSNSTWQDFRKIGSVIDETKHTLRLQETIPTLTTTAAAPTTAAATAPAPTIRKTYIKQHYIFQTWLPQEDGTTKLLQFDGAKIVGNPENRIKLIRKKYRRKLH